MFTGFFHALRSEGLPVTLREYLTLLEALLAGVADFEIERFYYIARATLVKDERNFDRFDRVFARHFEGLSGLGDLPEGAIPREWLRKIAERYLPPEELAKLEAMGWEKLMETLRKRLEEQKEAHSGGSKWIGTGGTSPFGAYGAHPEGVRIGQEGSRLRRAVKVWDRREYANLDGDAEVGTRNLKLVLRRLRRFTREGAAMELDLPETIRATAENAGWLDLKLVPERHNAVKVLLLVDAGGSMYDHVRVVEELFSAARAEFKHLETYYFHNCLYEAVWRDNRRRHTETTPTFDVLHTYGEDYKLIVLGDASMSPYEIVQPGAAVEHYNEESGEVWLRRLLRRFPHAAWINPVPRSHWEYVQSIQMIRGIFGDRMFPLTLDGMNDAMECLKR